MECSMEEGREAVEPQMESAEDALLPAHQPPLGSGVESAQQWNDGQLHRGRLVPACPGMNVGSFDAP